MRSFDQRILEELFLALGEYLEADGLQASLIIAGGASLSLQGLVTRTTTDVDVLGLVERDASLVRIRSASPLPAFLIKAAERVARDYAISPDWLNAEVARQWELGSPPGLEEEIEWRRFNALEVGFVGRRTLIALKLFAAVDQGPRSTHFQDLVVLRPTNGELADAADWVRDQDASEFFPQLVQDLIEDVRQAIRNDRPSG